MPAKFKGSWSLFLMLGLAAPSSEISNQFFNEIIDLKNLNWLSTIHDVRTTILNLNDDIFKAKSLNTYCIRNLFNL